MSARVHYEIMSSTLRIPENESNKYNIDATEMDIGLDIKAIDWLIPLDGRRSRRKLIRDTPFIDSRPPSSKTHKREKTKGTRTVFGTARLFLWSWPIDTHSCRPIRGVVCIGSSCRNDRPKVPDNKNSADVSTAPSVREYNTFNVSGRSSSHRSTVSIKKRGEEKRKTVN